MLDCGDLSGTLYRNRVANFTDNLYSFINKALPPEVVAMIGMHRGNALAVVSYQASDETLRHIVFNRNIIIKVDDMKYLKDIMPDATFRWAYLYMPQHKYAEEVSVERFNRKY